jgi:hypothetical protein
MYDVHFNMDNIQLMYDVHFNMDNIQLMYDVHFNVAQTHGLNASPLSQREVITTYPGITINTHSIV